jgi:Bacterial pre-peptidase C-terminal domain
VTRAVPPLAFLLAFVAWTVSSAEPKKTPPKDTPKVALAIPLGADPGTTTRITIRGLRLDKATAVRFQNPKITAKIVGKGSASVPDKNPEKVGNTQVMVEVTIPAGVTGESIAFVVVTPEGETPSHRLLFETAVAAIQEKEPNDGFHQAQKIRIPQVVDGSIGQPKDVDVFQLEGKAGQKIVCEVLAARFGSTLDSILTLYDAKGRQIASSDDIEDSTDSRLQVTLPGTGIYRLSVIDAHDTGGPTHVYRLVVKALP